MRNSESIFEKYIAMLYSYKYSYLHVYRHLLTKIQQKQILLQFV